MVHNIKELIFKVEFLGIDTQPLRDLLKLYHNNRELISNYKDSLGILNVLVLKTASPDTINQINLVLNELHPRVLKPQTIENKVTSEQSNSSSVLEIMTKLLDIKNDLNEIKSTRGTVLRAPTIAEDVNELNIGRVFINPIDNTKVDNIKSNVIIDSEMGGDISVKLDKLKKLKKS